MSILKLSLHVLLAGFITLGTASLVANAIENIPDIDPMAIESNFSQIIPNHPPDIDPNYLP